MIKKRKKSFRGTLFSLALRISLFTGLAVALLTAAICSVWLALSFWQLIGYSFGTGLLISGIAYVISYLILYQRLKTINRITKNIAKKRFEEYNNINTGHRDELDYLITQSVRASKTVEREIQRLNKIENYRKEFIGDISHELKTPIFAIQGFLETLIDGALEDEEVNRVFLNKAMRNVNRLIYLTKDLMEISKLETGELKSNIQELNIRNVILDVVESLQHKALKEGVEIRLGIFDKNIHVRADRNQIKQVLINLIENGMKYNHNKGFVEVGVRPYPKNRNKILVYIQDSGIGIEPRDIKRVTERFFRVDKSRSRERGGTGLGLSIVKHIIESHGENLVVESIPNEGSTFSFTLSLSAKNELIAV